MKAMKKLLLLLSVLFLFSSFLFNNDLKLISENPNDSKDSLTLIFAGDIMGHSPQFQAAYNPTTKTYNYDICFQEVKPYIEAADIAICNLEVPLAGRPYSGYPNFSSPDALLDGLKNAGYDIMLTANNHVVDRGMQGLERTIKTIKSRNLLHAGSYVDEIQRDSLYPLVVEQKGIRIAFLNCTYGTNGISVVAPNKVNYLDTLEIKNDIIKAKSKNVDFIVMTVHWGTEYELEGNSVQKMYADFFIRNGINLVVGSHPHVVQNAEIQYDKDSIPIPVFYSLGNSISNQRKPYTDGGILLKVVIGSQYKRILSTSYMPVYVHKGILNNVYQYHLVPTPQYFSDSANYQLNSKDKNSLIFFDSETRKRITNFDVFQ